MIIYTSYVKIIEAPSNNLFHNCLSSLANTMSKLGWIPEIVEDEKFYFKYGQPIVIKKHLEDMIYISNYLNSICLSKCGKNPHTIKCVPDLFLLNVSGESYSQLRKDDRNYSVGNLVIIQEFNEENREFTGNVFSSLINWKIKEKFGLKDNYCTFGLKHIHGLCVQN